MEQQLLVDADSIDTSLTDLPNHVLLNILSQLDLPSLCSCSRSCALLSKMAAHPSLPAWQNFKNDGWVLWDVRCTLARILRLPPQVGTTQQQVLQLQIGSAWHVQSWQALPAHMQKNACIILTAIVF